MTSIEEGEMLERARQRARRGFTMMEVLLVVGILAIVAALAAPNVVQAQASLRVTELDAKAQQIYNAAQYQLSALKTSGRLGALDPLDGNRLPATPSDYVATSTGEGSVNTVELLRFAAKGDSTTDSFILSSETASVTQGVTDGEYVVELNPLTGEVYAVFYWEGDADAIEGISPMTPETYYRKICTHRESARAPNSFRAQHHIGYYNGGEVSVLVAPSTSPGPGGTREFDLTEMELVLVNDEELYLRIFSPNGSLSETDFDPSKLKLTLVIERIFFDDNNVEQAKDATSRQAIVATINGGSTHPRLESTIKAIATPDGKPWGKVGYVSSDFSLDYRSSDGEIDFILDSMYSDGAGAPLNIDRFLNTTEVKIPKGSEIEVTVFATYEDTHWKQGPYRINSAYGKVHYDADAYEGAGGLVADVGNLRQLSNVSELSGDMWIGGFEITSDINFDGRKWNSNSVAAEHRDRSNLNPLYGSEDYEPMSPISLPSHINTSGNVVIDGNGHTLSGFVIEGTGDDTGLFENAGMTIQNMVLKDFKVTGGENTGALAGHIVNDSAKIVNCEVVGGTVNGTKNVGGLIGSATTEVMQGCSSSADVTGDENVGGVIGLATQATIQGCKTVNRVDDEGNYVIPEIRGANNVGGLAGQLVNAKLTNYTEGDGSSAPCTVIANVNATGEKAGGIAGSMMGATSTVENAAIFPLYDAVGAPTVGTVSGGKYVAGLVGYIEQQGALNDCAVEVNVVGRNMESSSTALVADYVGGLVGYAPTSSISVSRCSFNASYNTATGVPVIHDISGRSYIGGLFGETIGVKSEGNQVQAHVTGAGDYIGGLVGRCSSNSSRYNSCSIVPATDGSGNEHASTVSGPGSHIGAGYGENANNDVPFADCTALATVNRG